MSELLLIQILPGWLELLFGKVVDETRDYFLKIWSARYMYASTFATEIISAASFSGYWGLPQVWQIFGFYILAPLTVLAINFAGVKVLNVLTKSRALLLMFDSILVGSKQLVGFSRFVWFLVLAFLCMWSMEKVYSLHRFDEFCC